MRSFLHNPRHWFLALAAVGAASVALTEVTSISASASPRHERRSLRGLYGLSATALARTHQLSPHALQRLYARIRNSDGRSVAPSLFHSFAVFGAHPASTGPTLSAFSEMWLTSEPYGLNVGNARWVPTAGVWVVPGSSGVCVEDATYTDMCQSSAGAHSVANGGLIWTTQGGASAPAPRPGRGPIAPGAATGPITVGGLAPDGNASVAVTMEGGAVVNVPVSQNVYMLTTTDDPVSVALRTAAGDVTTLAVPK